MQYMIGPVDHYGYRWMLHRPNPDMFSKQGVCISTAAGAGTKWTNKDMADSMFFWGMLTVSIRKKEKSFLIFFVLLRYENFDLLIGSQGMVPPMESP